MSGEYVVVGEEVPPGVREIVLTARREGGYLSVMACEVPEGEERVTGEALIWLCGVARRANPKMAQTFVYYSLLGQVIPNGQIDGWLIAQQRADLMGHPACIGTGMVVATGGGVAE